MPENRTPDVVQFDAVEVIDEADQALLCVIEGEEHWIAKHLAVGSEVVRKGDRGRLVIPTWLANDYRLL
jgi:hypothetical protein